MQLPLAWQQVPAPPAVLLPLPAVGQDSPGGVAAQGQMPLLLPAVASDPLMAPTSPSARLLLEQCMAELAAVAAVAQALGFMVDEACSSRV